MMKELSMHIWDIVENSIRAKATMITIEMAENTSKDSFTLLVQDNGSGMSKEMALSIHNPFVTTKTTRRIGLGIPLLEQTCVQCNGGLRIQSQIGVGTCIIAWMKRNHIDRPPIGEMESVLLGLVILHQEVNFHYKYRYNESINEFSTLKVKELLDGVPFDYPPVIPWLKDYIYHSLHEIKTNSYEREEENE